VHVPGFVATVAGEGRSGFSFLADWRHSSAVNVGDRSIVLIGFMGTGKSSAGRHLEKLLGWPVFDTDAMIADRLGMPVAEIFSRFGEERFRAEETLALEKIEPVSPSIIVTGGGAILRPQNVVRLRELGTVVCLTANLAAMRQRLKPVANRPLLQSESPEASIESLLRRREPLYEAAADFTIDTSSLTHAQVAESIRQSLALTP
jgi:shikimate kinase